ncbi:hypothetical protein [Pseudomonas proteolytica]|uniref:hypothetical protein n=1 Tax=Pseudomonas proteolytica TaxID=219574 RepID=UPI001472C31C|nr:hypothetical protein [Pseudomonas proteolytica]NMY94966.1 hypothetical protein [Pseudomonas proteolytica]
MSSKLWARALSVVVEHPVRVAFFGSLLLSLIAVLGAATVGRDAAFYLTIAQDAQARGPKAAFELFNWSWFPLLLAATHSVSRLPVELSAYLWCSFFAAGTCALLVDCVRQRSVRLAPWACLVVLAMPAFNEFRGEILREFGFWFFCVLAIWLAMRWQVRGGWLRAANVHLAIVAASAFRLEALLLLPALGLWQMPGLWVRGQRRAILQFFALPLLGVVLGAVLVSITGGFSSERVDYYLSLINPGSVLTSFDLLREQFANSLINKYSQGEAGRIIFFGMLAAMAISFVGLTGPFAVPFLLGRNWRVITIYCREYRPFAWAAVLYLLILMLFFIQQQFMITRYMSFLNLLFVPALALGLQMFARQFPRLGKVLVAVCLLVMLSNVVSTGAGKTQYIDAGRWMAANVDPNAPAYFDDGRIGYYAGRGYLISEFTREEAMSPANAGKFRYFFIEARGNEPWLTGWLAERNLRIVERFANRRGATVLVIGQ